MASPVGVGRYSRDWVISVMAWAISSIAPLWLLASCRFIASSSVVMLASAWLSPSRHLGCLVVVGHYRLIGIRTVQSKHRRDTPCEQPKPIEVATRVSVFMASS
jgi:hypothetical protein